MSTAALARDTAQEGEDLESWRNATPGTVIIVRFSELGRLIDHVVLGGRPVQLTPRERRINEERAATEKLNPFRNGTMQAVRLIESEADTAEIASNPNSMAESEIIDLFGKGNWKTFAASVNKIESPLLLHRLLEVANSDAVNATVRQLQSIKERLAATENPDNPIVDDVMSSSQPLASF